MPTVYNGIGTWYYGKRRIHRVKSSCASCDQLVELESYDTTLFFVVFFIPVIPLGSKRILDSCPSCRQHRYMKLADWEKARSNVLSDLTSSLQAGTNRSEAIINALGAAWTFQDEQILDQIAPLAREQSDARVHQELGRTYGYFSRWPEAETAQRRAIQIESNPERIDLLALALLKQGRPDEALSMAQTVLADRNVERAWVVELMIEAYQAAGRHQEALKLMDARDQAFPEAVSEFSKIQRKLSEKNLESGRPIRSAFLSDSKKAGYREGSGWRSKAPWVIGPAIAIALLAWYLGAAWWIGENRKVYLLNGSKRPYKVVINGHEATVPPGHPMPIRIAEGDIKVSLDGIDLGEIPTGHIETSFASRPFANHTFVINPDRLAGIVWEEVEYTQNNRGGGKARPPKLHMGELLYHFDGLDFEFQPFPSSLEMHGNSMLKTRVEAHTFATLFERAASVAESIPEDQRAEYVRRMVRTDPDDAESLYWLVAVLKQDDLLNELKRRLGDRPVRVEWHRMYQATQEALHPDVDLKPDYRKLVEENHRSPDSLYLLGRIEDDAARLSLYHEAVAANPPCVAAMVSLGYRHLAAGELQDANKWLAKAKNLQPDDLRTRHYYRDGLLAAGDYRQLIQETAGFGKDPRQFREHLVAQYSLGDEMAAQAAARQFQTAMGMSDAQAITNWLKTISAQAARDRRRYLVIAKASEDGAFAMAILEGRPRDAATAYDKVPHTDSLSMRPNLIQAECILCLAAEKAGDKALADERLKRLVELLQKDDREARLLAKVLSGTQPYDFETFRTLVINTEEKRFIALLLANRHSEDAEKLRELARKLNFHRDTEGLCLAALLEK